jgi:hypothetical protein
MNVDGTFVKVLLFWISESISHKKPFSLTAINFN